MNKKLWVIIGIISSFLLCNLGVYRLIMESPEVIEVPIIFAISGFVGFIEGLLKLKEIIATEIST